MNNVILFSNDCPRCKILKEKMINKNIEFEVSDNFDELIEHGLQTTPVLKVNNEYYQFGDAVKLIGELA